MPSVMDSPHYPLVQALYALPRLTGVVGHRRRSDFLYRSSASGVPLLYRWDEAAGGGQLLTPGDEPVLGPAVLHPEHPWIALGQDAGGSENHALHLLDLTSGRRHILTEPLGRLTAIHWLGDDAWLVVGSNQVENFVRRIERDGRQHTLYRPESWVQGSALDEARGRLVLSLSRGRSTNYDLAILDSHTGQILHWLSESDHSREVWPAVAGDWLAYTTNVSETHEEVVCRSLDDFRELGRFPIPGDALDLTWGDDHTLLVAVARHAVIGPHLLDIFNGHWTERLSAGSSWSVAATREGPVWIESSLAQPGTLKRQAAAGPITLLATTSDQTFIAGEDRWYPSFDGRLIQGWLLRQPRADAPLVVYAHGGPTSVTADMWRNDLQALALAGYHVFAPNYRGSASFGAAFRDLNLGDIGGGDAQDVLYGARYAAEALGVRTRPAIMGGSYGGYLTLWALTTQPEAWAGGVGLVPVADWVEDYYLLDASFRYYDVHFFGGTPEEKPDLYRERSPITHLARLQAPLLIIHGENDSRCAIQPVIKFAHQAQAHGQPVTMIITRDEGHGSVRNANAIRDLTLALDHLAGLWR